MTPPYPINCALAPHVANIGACQNSGGMAPSAPYKRHCLYLREISLDLTI